MSKVKKLFAIHTDAFGKVYRTKIVEGTTGDFANPIGFQVEDFEENNTPSSDGVESLGLNGTYPALLTESFSHLEGKLLTICDATFTNKEQRQAFKSVIKDSLWTMFAQEVEKTQGNYSIAERNTLN